MNSPAVPDAREQEFAALVRALKVASGFKLIFVKVDQAVERDRLMRRAERAVGRRQIQRLKVGRPASQAVELLKRRRDPMRPITFLYGMEGWLGADAATSRFINSINVGRNELPSAVDGVLVIWAPSFLIAAIQAGAPDLFSVRSGLYGFESVGVAGSFELWRVAQILGPKLFPETPLSMPWLVEAFKLLNENSFDEQRLEVAAGAYRMRDWRALVSVLIVADEGVVKRGIAWELLAAEGLARVGRRAEALARLSLIGAGFIQDKAVEPWIDFLIAKLAISEFYLDDQPSSKGAAVDYLLSANEVHHLMIEAEMRIEMPSELYLIEASLAFHINSHREGRWAYVFFPERPLRCHSLRRLLYTWAGELGLALSENPIEHGMALEVNARHLLADGRLAEAVDKGRSSIEILSNTDLVDRSPVRQACETLAQVYDATGDHESARDMRRAAATETDRPSVIDLLSAS